MTKLRWRDSKKTKRFLTRLVWSDWNKRKEILENPEKFMNTFEKSGNFSNVSNVDDIIKTWREYEQFWIWKWNAIVNFWGTEVTDKLVDSLKSKGWSLSDPFDWGKSYISKDWLEKINIRTVSSSAWEYKWLWYDVNSTIDIFRHNWEKLVPTKEIKFLTNNN